MKIEYLINKVSKMDYPQKLSKEYDGGCPCFYYYPIVDGVKIEIHGHCWRTCQECAYNGLHITGKLPRKDLMKIAKVFKKQLDAQEWYSPYELVVKSLLKKEKI